ncbi:MAG: DHH family phosphoesterase [Bacteroidota bacterium]
MVQPFSQSRLMSGQNLRSLSSYNEAIQLLRESSSIVITTHINPDGDGIGSELALSRALRYADRMENSKTGFDKPKTVSIINVNPTPKNYQFLDIDHEIRTFDETQDAPTILQADLIVVLDTNHPMRLRTMEPYVLQSNAQKLCIDHHLDTSNFADVYLIDEEASSTGEIIMKIVEELTNHQIDPQMATCLYAAIMTDTGSFRYPRTDAELHRAIANLLELGADPTYIYDQIYDQWSPNRLRLLGNALSNIRVLYDGKLAIMTVTQEMLSATATTEAETDNFSTYPMSIAGVVVGVLLVELPDGVKMSFRSKGDLWVNRLAQIFGGNGHKNAAGALVFDRRLEEVQSDVLLHAGEFLK